MRIVDLSEAVVESAETLQAAAIMPGNYMASCGDLAPEELCEHIAQLARLARLANTLMELGLSTLTEEQ